MTKASNEDILSADKPLLPAISLPPLSLVATTIGRSGSLFRSRKDVSNKVTAKVTQDSSPEVVDVYAVRHQQV